MLVYQLKFGSNSILNYQIKQENKYIGDKCLYFTKQITNQS